MIDQIEITAKAGDGGNGAVSLRREKYVPRGGPDGGDGGNGGDVVVISDRSARTLKETGRRRLHRAERGQNGMPSDKHGRGGKSLELHVPPGTQVFRLDADGTEEKIADLVADGQSAVVAKGGIGGWGNARFSTPVHQTPRIAQVGQPGQEVRLRLELKLLADVGIVGLPNAGKSTLLRAISAARPKVADYPFTTLEPVLGVAENGWERFVVADIPGLIEGAHEGAGLGLDFLRHIERTRVILHMIDGSSADPLADMDLVNRELSEYGHGLETRPQVVTVNKLDMPEVAERRGELERAFRGRGLEPLFISAAGLTGLDEVIQRLTQALAVAPPPAETEAAPPPVLRPVEDRRGVTVTRESGAYRVSGERVVTFAEMMPVESEEGRAEVWRRLTRWGVVGQLRRAGAKRGDAVRIGGAELEFEP